MTETTTPRRHLVLTCLLIAIASSILMLASHRPAWADYYSIDRVDIDATLNADSSLQVRETRKFDFGGSFHGVYWKIPEGTYEGREVEASVTGCGIVNPDGTLSEFKKTDSGDDGTYRLSRRDGYQQVKLYSPQEDTTVNFYVTFTYSNLATRWADTGELYWKFVSDGWDEESENVTCTVHLPVPAGQEADGTVRAWGHGPLDGTVNPHGSSVVCVMPGVGTSEFAEVRIAFPQEWLSKTKASSSKRLETILAEEQAWADEANARRERARQTITAFETGLPLGMLAVIVAGAWAVISDRRANKTQFSAPYYRDVPTEDHPVVLSTLVHDGKVRSDDFTANIMRLCDIGAAELVQAPETERKGKSGDNWRLVLKVNSLKNAPRRGIRRDQSASDAADRIDQKLLTLLFDYVARMSGVSDKQVKHTGVSFEQIRSVAKSAQSGYANRYDGWKDAATQEAIKRGFCRSGNSKANTLMRALGIIAPVIGLGALTAWLFLDLNGKLVFGLFVLGFVLRFIARRLSRGMQNLTPEGAEVRAKLLALRRWLKDFTRLDEAFPRDVAVWNRLLVMAVCLGVSKEVISQLKTKAPEVIRDPRFSPLYGWYMWGPSERHSPYNDMSAAATRVHNVSAQTLAQSTSSSGGGFGGGFSGGGGGGFGGGGGGGAW